MKKLMIALAAVAMGFAANAASYNWSAPSGRLLDGTDTTGAAHYVSGNAYLLFTSVLSQSDLVTAFAADAASAASTVSTKSLSTATIGSDARVADTSFTADVTANQTAYFVVFNEDNMYISDTVEATYAAVGTSTVEFGSLTASSRALPKDASAGYSAAGWYGAAAVPEPTSGLLLLLGMAGLALKRKRA